MAIAYLGTLPGIGVTGVRRWAIFCGLAAFRIVNHVGLPSMKGGADMSHSTQKAPPCKLKIIVSTQRLGDFF
jgi:hypothetical protein